MVRTGVPETLSLLLEPDWGLVPWVHQTSTKATIVDLTSSKPKTWLRGKPDTPEFRHECKVDTYDKVSWGKGSLTSLFGVPVLRGTGCRTRRSSYVTFFPFTTLWRKGFYTLESKGIKKVTLQCFEFIKLRLLKIFGFVYLLLWLLVCRFSSQ